MEQISTIGLDITKSVFQVHGVSGTGDVVGHRRLVDPIDTLDVATGELAAAINA